MPTVYSEDLTVGDVERGPPLVADREQMLRTRARFDPWPFHVDEQAAAASPFGGLIASRGPAGRDAAAGLNAVVTVGLRALLLLWRGYADPAPRTRPGLCSDSARGLLAEVLSSLLVARCASAGIVSYGPVGWLAPAGG
jgi:hypothetical protein